jgi:uncharacterized membrane protein YcaP (DUF421 family)
MSPFQLVIIFMIAELAAIPIESTSAALFNGVIAIFTLLFLQTFISTISIKCEWFKNLMNGKPSILIDKGEINQKELKALRITLNDLMEQLRIKNISSLSDVEYAIMESNGELSVIQKSAHKPVTRSDIGINEANSTLPMVIISDGILYKKNLYRMQWQENELNALLNKHDISVKEVFLAFTDSKKRFHIYTSSSDKSTAKELLVCETL